MKEIQVVVAIILDRDKKVLLSKRQPDAHLGGFWEFPGGKVAAGESHIFALKRELKEEVDIDIKTCQLLSEGRHVDREKNIRLFFYLVGHYIGVAKGNEGQQLQWVDLACLKAEHMPPANSEIIQKLKSDHGVHS